MDEDVALKLQGMQAMRRPWPVCKAVEVVRRALIFALQVKREMVLGTCCGCIWLGYYSCSILLEYAVCLVYLSYYTGQLGGVLAWFYDIPLATLCVNLDIGLTTWHFSLLAGSVSSDSSRMGGSAPMAFLRG